MHELPKAALQRKLVSPIPSYWIEICQTWSVDCLLRIEAGTARRSRKLHLFKFVMITFCKVVSMFTSATLNQYGFEYKLVSINQRKKCILFYLIILNEQHLLV